MKSPKRPTRKVAGNKAVVRGVMIGRAMAKKKAAGKAAPKIAAKKATRRTIVGGKSAARVKKYRVQMPSGLLGDNVLVRMSDDLRTASRSMSQRSVRSLVDYYYAMQKIRIASEAMSKALADNNEPHDVIDFICKQQERLEDQVQNTLDIWSLDHADGAWLREIVGIGPVISSGLIAQINIAKTPTAGSLWRYSGLDPTVVWGPGQPRPWNARLKLLAWKAGESFIKCAGLTDCFYGQMYQARREIEDKRNQRGDYANEAINVLLTRNFRKTLNTRRIITADIEQEIQTTISWYRKGMFPPGRIHLRATRYACTIFLSHLHEVMHYNHFHLPAPRPYVYDYLGHAHIMEPPHLDKFPEMARVIRARQPMIHMSKYIERMRQDYMPKPPNNIPMWFNGKREIPEDMLAVARALLPQNRINGDEPLEGME